ncbi:MAG: DUF3189 family protein [Firmicutes bacterium]|nr:DUF3189 family protein [Bacillota bacterium]
MAGKRIIYHCYGGAHSSVVAAALHLGKLSPDKVPSAAELLKLALFDRQTNDGHGQLHFFGFDEWQNQVYSVGCRNVGETVEKFLLGVAKILGVSQELLFVDTLHCVSLKMRIGGYISRRLGLISLGRPLVVAGTREAYTNLAALVHRVKAEVNR